MTSPVLASEFKEVYTANSLKLLVQDWGQTREFRANRPDLYEMNIILGRHPSIKDVNIYMGMCSAIYLTSALSLPKEYSYALSSIIYLVESWAVINNAKLGVNPDFDTDRYANMITFTLPF